MQEPNTKYWIDHAELINLLMGAEINLGMRSNSMMMWVSTPVSKFHKAICEKAGLDAQEYMTKKLPYVYTPMNAALIENLGIRGIYGNEAAERKNYYLQIIENGSIWVKYSQIIGSWCIGKITPDEYQAFVDLMAEKLKILAK